MKRSLLWNLVFFLCLVSKEIVLAQSNSSDSNSATVQTEDEKGKKQSTSKSKKNPDKAAAAIPGGTTTLPDVVVTATSPEHDIVATQGSSATKTGTPLLETPQSIYVITREEMDEHAVQTINEALRYSVGVVANDNAGERFDGNYEYIRGFIADTYLDGLKVNGLGFSVPVIDPYLLDRIEVVHGPTSVLYGQSSPGGFINMISKMPTAKPFYEAQLQFGNYNEYQAAMDLGGPIDKDGKFTYRLTGIARQNDTQINYTQFQHMAIAPAFTWRSDEDTTLTLLTSFESDPKAGFYASLPVDGTIQQNPNGPIPRDFFTGDPDFLQYQKKTYNAGYQFERRLGDIWTVRQNTRYVHLDSDYHDLQLIALDPDERTLYRLPFTTEDHLDTFQMDTQGEAKFLTGPVEHTLLLGVDYQYTTHSQNYMEGDFNNVGIENNIDMYNPVYTQATFGPDPFYSRVRQTQDQVGIYLQDQVKWQHWILTLGGREDWADSSAHDLLQGAGADQDQSDQASTMRGGLGYAFDNGIAPYVSYSESFVPNGGTDFDGKPFDPTRGVQEEVGVKYQPKNFPGFFSVAAYNLTQTNVLTTDPDPSHFGFNVETGQIRSRGIETDAHVTPFKGWNLTANYAFLDNVVTESNAGDQGTPIPGIYKHQASLWSDYTFQEGWMKGFGVGVGMRYLGHTFGDNRFFVGPPVEMISVPETYLFDAAVHYDFGAAFPELKGLRAAVNVNNVADTTYFSETGYSTAKYGTGRLIRGSITYEW